jgi:hypothetical protein
MPSSAGTRQQHRHGEFRRARSTIGTSVLSNTSGHAREQRIPRAVVLRTISPSTGKSTLQDAQAPDLIDVELLPSVRRTALTLTADLKSEQALDATPDAVVVRLDDAVTPAFVDKLDETLVNDRAYEIVIHRFTTDRRSASVRRSSWGLVG